MAEHMAEHMACFTSYNWTKLKSLCKDKSLITVQDNINLIIYVIGLLINKTSVKDYHVFLFCYIVLKYNWQEPEILQLDSSIDDLALYPYTYKLITTMLDQHTLTKSIEMIQYQIKKTNCKFKKLINTSQKQLQDLSLESLDILINYNISTLMASYNDGHFIASLKFANCNYTKRWTITMTEEIETRLKSLVKYFGISILNFLDAPIIDISEFDGYDIKQKIEYYFMFVSRVTFGFRTMSKIIAAAKKQKNKMAELCVTYDMLLRTHSIEPSKSIKSDMRDSKIVNIINSFFM